MACPVCIPESLAPGRSSRALSQLERTVNRTPLFSLALITLWLCGCETFKRHQLSKAQSVKIAQEFGSGNGREMRNFEIQYVTFDSGKRKWQLQYTGSQGPLAIVVDDRTGDATFSELFWK